MSPRHVKTSSRERGLTLVEVLAAVTVLAIALVAVFRMLDIQTQSTAGLSGRLFAHWAALNVLEEARMEAAPREGQSERTVELGGIAWKVTSRGKPVAGSLVRFEVTVAAEGHPGAVLVGFLYPEMSDAQ